MHGGITLCPPLNEDGEIQIMLMSVMMMAGAGSSTDIKIGTF